MDIKYVFVNKSVHWITIGENFKQSKYHHHNGYKCVCVNDQSSGHGVIRGQQ